MHTVYTSHVFVKHSIQISALTLSWEWDKKKGKSVFVIPDHTLFDISGASGDW